MYRLRCSLYFDASVLEGSRQCLLEGWNKNLSLTPYSPCRLMHRQLRQYYCVFGTAERYHRVPWCFVKTNVKSDGVAAVNGRGTRGEREPPSPLSMDRKMEYCI